MSTGPTDLPGDAAMSGDQALADALRAVLGPVARLALAKGVPFAALEEMLKEAVVDEALNAQSAQANARLVSRISVATGLNRREVTRLTRRQRTARAVRQSPVAEVFARWQTDPRYLDAGGLPRSLPRVAGDAATPSFEGLAQSVTRDVHPRSLLDELCRLGVARMAEGSDEVMLVRNAFVPSDAQAAMLGFLGDNVGDHLAAAVANVLAAEPPHFEQAVFADDLSAESIEVARDFVLAQWNALMKSAVPLLEGLIEQDQQAGRKQDQRLRIGLYSYADVAAPLPPPDSVESERD